MMCAVNLDGRPEGCMNDGEESTAPRDGDDFQGKCAGKKDKACRLLALGPSSLQPWCHHQLQSPWARPFSALLPPLGWSHLSSWLLQALIFPLPQHESPDIRCAF